MICIYHSRDLDGYCSGAIVKRKYPDAVMIGYDYGNSLPMDKIPPNTPIIMVDVSLPMYAMASLSSHSNYQMTWIDHHVSAINDYKNHDHMGINAVLESGIAACEGAWKYLFPTDEMPLAVELLGEYDTWRNGDKEKWDNSIMPFQYGMRMICSSPETFPSALLARDAVHYQRGEVEKITNSGRLILSYQDSQNERACRMSFETEFQGYRAICLNIGGASSTVFKSVYDETKHDIMIPFVYTGKFWSFSIYSTKSNIDCSVLAKKMGGGGHKQAAGFQVDEIPSEFKK